MTKEKKEKAKEQIENQDFDRIVSALLDVPPVKKKKGTAEKQSPLLKKTGRLQPEH